MSSVMDHTGHEYRKWTLISDKTRACFSPVYVMSETPNPRRVIAISIYFIPDYCVIK